MGNVMCVLVYVHVCACACACACVCACVCTCVCACVCLCMCMLVYVHEPIMGPAMTYDSLPRYIWYTCTCMSVVEHSTYIEC